MEGGITVRRLECNQRSPDDAAQPMLSSPAARAKVTDAMKIKREKIQVDPSDQAPHPPVQCLVFVLDKPYLISLLRPGVRCARSSSSVHSLPLVASTWAVTP